MSVGVAASAAVGLIDWSVDRLRAAVGLDPRPPSLSLRFESRPKVREQTALQAEMRRTVYAHALIEQDEAVLFDAPMPLDGRIGVMPMTPEPIRARVSQEGRDPTARHGTAVTETVIEPLPNGPPVEWFKVPATVTLGGNIVPAWHAPRADRVRLAVIEDGEVSDHIGPPTGQIIVPALRPCRVLLRLTAETGWGETTLTREVTVAPPALKLIALRPAVQAAYPGDTLRFGFKATGAESLWLIGPDDDAPKRHDDNSGGFLIVTLGLQPVEFEVIARGYGGAERSLVLRALPDLTAGLETDHH
jgi:hypothetical protein